MIPVKKYQLLFSQHNEDCVKQFKNLRSAEHEEPETSHAVVRDEAAITDRGGQSSSGESEEKLCPHPPGSQHTEQ